MERHLSTGIVTIVAAHRAACGQEGTPAADRQEEFAWINAYLYEDGPAELAAAASSPTARRRRLGCHRLTANID
jgi:hypothetical protein